MTSPSRVASIWSLRDGPRAGAADLGVKALTLDDPIALAGESNSALMSGIDADWTVRAGELTWRCRRTVDHTDDSLLHDSAHFATRATERLPFVWDGDPVRSVAQLLMGAGAGAAILSEVCRAAPAGAREFHPPGMADATGSLAMGGRELLSHTFDMF